MYNNNDIITLRSKYDMKALHAETFYLQHINKW